MLWVKTFQILNINHVRLHPRDEVLVVKRDNVLFTTFSLHLLNDFIIYLFSKTISLAVLHNDFVKFKVETYNL
jgi:hypothetical protein